MYFDQEVKEVFEKLDSSEKGLSKLDAQKRLEKYGPNTLKEKKQKTALQIFLSQFNSIIVWILIAALFISAFLGEYIDAGVIGVIVILNAVFGFIQEYKAEKAIQALKKLTSLKATVLREGKLQKIDAAELVPGDVISLEEGDKVPADARIFELQDLDIQEATLTGESVPVGKKLDVVRTDAAVAERKNMVFSSTIVTRGHCKAVVAGTGMESEIGKIATLIQEEPESTTPLQKKLAGLGKWLGVVTIFICAVVFGAGVLKGNPPIEMFLTAVSLAVAAIPEGLPAVVTISLALGVQRMVKRHALMRKLPSVETLGSVTVICSDKTGTLTHNEMTVRKIYLNGEVVEVSGEGYKPVGKFSHEPKGLDMLLGIGAMCNNASLDPQGNITGDPTEACLITSAAKNNVLKVDLEKKYPRVDELPFDSARKLMSTLNKVGDKKVVYTKGAPDQILKICTKIYDKGKIRAITSEDKNKILKQNEEFANQALRVLGFAYKENPTSKNYESDLIFMGLQAMIDPPRAEVRDAIERCKSAGIKPVVITGDHKTTALAIANELGIEGEAISGEELDKIEHIDSIVDKIAVYARVNPEHKMRIIEALQRKGNVVAMTGDGVNDAPALKKADIGVCVGSGTDVAKEASAMVLTDDNYSSIVNAVEEGRGIYDNIKKFVNYLLSSNIGEVLILFVATLLGWPLPLVAVQILWINLVTDGLPALALGVDPISKDVMQRKPRNPKEHIVSANMTLNIIIVGVLICIGTLFLFNKTLSEFGDVDRARTVAFSTLVVLELVRVYMVRAKYKLGVFSNKYLILAVLSSIALQVAVVYSPLNFLFKAVPLMFSEWLMMGAVALILLAIGFVANKVIGALTHELD